MKRKDRMGMNTKKRRSCYVLYAAIVHSGTSAQHGHYYCIGRSSSRAQREMQAALVRDRDAAGDSMPVPAKDSLPGHDWWQFNDSSVTPSTHEALDQITNYFQNDVPYILFYKKVESGRESEAEQDEAVAYSEEALESVERDNDLLK
eukprot:TRINITY_DN5911_c0_g1_i1.p2 TRINITY_DN5911_c0_g1~~TRINITY_DN5911_c0_g1_i1.p2  ORF type:complete len:147 (-),score=24.65 TRINITY_DN5911_c0_g1_i1:182-622(-)